MQRIRDSIKTRVNKLTLKYKRDSKPLLTGNDYNWYLAQTAGMLPESAKKYFEPKAAGYSGETNQAAGRVNKFTNVSKYSNQIAFLALVLLSIVVQVWLSMINELITSGPSDTSDWNSIFRLTGVESYGTIVTVNGIVVTAIALWLALTESRQSRMQTTIRDVKLSKQKLLTKLGKQLKVVEAEPHCYLGLVKFLKRPRGLRLKVRKIPDGEQLRNLNDDLNSVNSRASDLDLSMGILLGSVIALSASLAIVGTIAETFRYFREENDELGLVVIWVGCALCALHLFLFDVVGRDLIWARDALNDAKWGGNYRRSMKYMVQLLSFVSQDSKGRKYPIIYKWFESVYFNAMGSVVLILMIFLCFVPSPALQGYAYMQWILAAVYIVLGLVLPNALIFYDVKRGSVFTSAVDTDAVRLWRRFLMARCYLINIFWPVSCALLLPSPCDYWWYLWWNPVFSACAFWLSRRILFELTSRSLAVSAASFLTEIESHAARQLHFK